MIFKDEVNIYIRSGKGGDGAVSFRREKYIPKGGPDGGDGGKGGDIIFKVNPHLRTLSAIHNNQKFIAKNGQNGMGNKCHGADAKDIIIEVPQGTQIIDADRNVLLYDMKDKDSVFVAAKGGKGGKGNFWFRSPTNQTPFYAEKGKEGQEFNLKLSLKMIAHIGFVGFPNAGKSTLISRITNARPKIADYPFTTLHPNLGVMTLDDSYTSLLIADIPGIIEGAHLGKGLGIEFLKHIERTKIILFVLDILDKPYEKFKILRSELKKYSNELYKKKYIIALNKIDMLYDKDVAKDDIKKLKRYKTEMIEISALTGTNLDKLKILLYKSYIESESGEKSNEGE